MKKVLLGVCLLCMLVVGAGLSGCDSTGATSTTSMAEPTYVIVTPTNGTPYTVMIPAGDPDHTKIISKKGTATCAECIRDAKAYALTGKMDEVCKSCGARREAVVSIPTIGHN